MYRCVIPQHFDPPKTSGLWLMLEHFYGHQQTLTANSLHSIQQGHIRRFYGRSRYGDLNKRYEVSLSQMLHDILGHDHIQYTLNWLDITPIFELITELDLITDFDLITKFGGFHRTLQRGAASQTEDAYSSGHLVLSQLGIAFVLMLRPFFPELVMSMELLSFEYPSVLLFCFGCHIVFIS